MIPATASRHRPRSRPEASTIDAAKEKVPVLDYADLLAGPGQMRRIGRQWVARCPLPDHEDRTPSFSVDPDKNVWYCHGCVRGGSVVDLAMLAREIPEPKAAAGDVLLSFGHEPPSRPRSWTRKQRRQARLREAIERERRALVARRLHRICFAEILEGITDPDERAAEERHMQGVSERLAQMMLEARGRG